MTHRLSRLWIAALVVLGACGNHHSGGGNSIDATPDVSTGATCTNDLTCFQVNCAAKSLPTTTVSGVVHAPNGTLPLYGVNVYVPDSDPGPLVPGVTCGQCAAQLPGNPVVTTTTDEAGHFELQNVPATANVPIVIQVGKWRKQIKLPTVAPCQDTPLAAIDTDLPKSGSDTGGDIVSVDLPQIAITTGSADALECLPRKLGIADTEFTTDAGSGHVHLFSGNGTDQFNPGFAGGSGAFSTEATLWNNDADPVKAAAKLDKYDLMFFSCEGGQDAGDKPQAAMDNVKAYANLGGRIFMSHWHNIWIGGETGKPAHGEADWEKIATWNFSAPQNQDSVTTLVDTSTPHGVSYAKWLENVGASPIAEEVAITQARYTCSAIDETNADRFIYVDPTLSPGNTTKESSVTDFQFTTDVTLPLEQRCGKVVFSDMHVSASSSSVAGTAAAKGKPYPTGCDTGDLTPQEKALAFIFFDIASCISPIN